MSTLGPHPTLLTHSRRMDPNGKVARVAELLLKTNEILTDMVYIEGNLPTGHRTTVRTGLPSTAWRKLNYGIQPSKSTTKQVDDTCGMLEAYAEVDKNLADLNANTSEFRVSEDRAFLEAMNQAMAETMFYGDTSKHPERFLGLAPRFCTKDLAQADNAENVLDAGGTGANCSSIWLVSWGDNTVHAFYPKGSQSGFKHNDLGEVTLHDDAGGMYQGYRTHYKWDIGLCVRDWRYVVRIANVPKTLTNTKLVDLMIEASEMLPNKELGTPAFYMNRQIRTALRKEIANKGNVHLNLDQASGKTVMYFDEIPVRRCDVLHYNETAI